MSLQNLYLVETVSVDESRRLISSRLGHPFSFQIARRRGLCPRWWLRAMGDDERPVLSDLETREAALFDAERSLASLHVAEITDHAFWETQPVGQLKPELDRHGPDGPIDDPISVDDVQQEGYALPSAFVWSSCDMNDPKTQEEVYDLLDKNYVEDDDAMFRFCYSKEFLRWALQPPGYHVDWHLGVRVKESGKIVAFISGVPAKMVVNGEPIALAEINFLCIHKKLRAKRLAPMLIREITRRVNLHGVWQAAYTAGVVLPKPIGTARYWHRSLNVKKLIEIGFTHLHPRMTMSRTIKLFKLGTRPTTPGVRPMVDGDVPKVCVLLNKYLRKFSVAPEFSEEEVKHHLSQRDGVVYSYVVEDPLAPGAITDFISFYSLPSTVIKKQGGHKTLKAAYSYYNVPAKTDIKQLMEDALILAKSKDFDVFNALDLMENAPDVLMDLRFGIGDGNLRYYLYNWRVAEVVLPSQIGLVLT